MLKRGADLISNVQVCIILRSRRQRLGRSHVFWGPRGGMSNGILGGVSQTVGTM